MVANIRCKSYDYYSERNWHPPAACVEQATCQVRSRSHERGRVKLAWTASISLLFKKSADMPINLPINRESLGER
jgi:hypothetical protein